MRAPVRVLVVDDSALMRKLIPQLLQGDPSIQVVGTAMDGLLGLKKIEELRPDVVTLDLEMPRMDGLDTLREIVRRYSIPVIVVSSHTSKGAYSALNALSQGAFDFIAKPTDSPKGGLEQIAKELAVKIKVAAISGPPKLTLHTTPHVSPAPKPQPSGQRPSRVIAIGISTGGPNALDYLCSELPADFSGCLLIVQHMPEGFTGMFARRLNDTSPIHVAEALSGDLLRPGRAFICPGNRHMKIRRTPQGDMIVLVDMAPVNGHRPSVDVLFRSVAKELGKDSAAVIMTGMGDDGAGAMQAVQAVGGVTIAQSPETCVVDSMPASAIKAGFATRVVPLEALPSVLQVLCQDDGSGSRGPAELQTLRGERR
ncbi:MAG TPA: chemotaxis response regulator protein-glutamate methylesterase [Verrucomicrobiae bacterium]|jgi:two-component system chemotaxis response regulator CheB|nr:chemotaxis response regulator protein-glutamate methylesterase [Verrucomicrobiae bacterium]